MLLTSSVDRVEPSSKWSLVVKLLYGLGHVAAAHFDDVGKVLKARVIFM